MFGDGPLTFREFATREPYPLAMVHDAVLGFLRHRDDCALCGSQAINAYIDDPRMTQDVDIVSPRAMDLAEEIRQILDEQFEMALKVRTVRDGLCQRIYQVRQPKHRNLVDVYRVNSLPPSRRIQEVLVLTPPELIAAKILCICRPLRRTKRFLDLADVQKLLLEIPELKTEEGPVAECLRATGTSDAVMAAWKDLVAQEILSEDEDAKFFW
jgi:hypothetical protein